MEAVRMFLAYAMNKKIKACKCFNYRAKTVVECENVRIDEKFGTNEKMVDYNLVEEEYIDRMLKFPLRITMIFRMM